MSDVDYQLTDRRPIAARGWSISRKMSSWLGRRGVSPNGISVIGMIAALAAGGCLAATAYCGEVLRILWAAAGLLIAVRLLANMFDGMVAIETNRASSVGELFNEVPDRVSDSAVLIGLGYVLGSDPIAGLIAAIAAMLTAYVRAVGKAAGAPSDFRGPMAKQQRMFLVIALCAVGTVAPYTTTARIENTYLTLPIAVLWVIAMGSLLTAARRFGGIAAKLRGRS
jgi:phosphatidylglycerophosphate synthase